MQFISIYLCVLAKITLKISKKLSLFSNMGLQVKFERRKAKFELKGKRNVIFGRYLSSLYSKEATKRNLWSFWLKFLGKKVKILFRNFVKGNIFI